MKEEITRWASEQLVSQGYSLNNDEPEVVLETPWSSVMRFDTADGLVYLKIMPELIALEAGITQVLHDQFKAPVPEVIAYNDELHCFLMKDAGRPLREVLKQDFDVGLLCRAIGDFSALQNQTADHVDLFLNMGVPDWRLDKLSGLFKELLLEKEVLLADGLSEKEIDELTGLLPTVTELCKQLAAYSIPETLVQCDFHDNNILIGDAGKLTFIDLGEVVISHPFFSLAGCLWQAKKHHDLTEQNDAYQQLLSACFKSDAQLAAYSITQKLWHVYGVLAQYRLMMACGVEQLIAYQRGRLGGALREVLGLAE